jgi:hypothetical protein
VAARTIALDLKSALAHLRPDADTRIRLEGVPESMRLSAGRAEGDGIWLLTAVDLDDLAVIAPASFHGPSPLSVVLVRAADDGAEAVSSFGLLLTPEGAVSAFSGLEPEDDAGDIDAVSKLRASVGKGRGKLKVKKAKRPLDFGDQAATTAFVAQRSTAHLEALFRGELAYNDGITAEASLEVQQRLELARKMWEGELAQQMAAARTAWEDDRARLHARIGELEEQLHLTMQELNQLRAETSETPSSVRGKLIDIVARLSDEHAAELAEIERRLRQEAEEMLAAARAEWECTGGFSTN